MPIVRTVKGNLISMFKEGRFDEVVHGCNCFNNMGAGIARQIARAFPEVFAKDRTTDKGFAGKLGTFNHTKIESVRNGNGMVCNMYTQYYPGNEDPDVLYKTIRQGFTKLNDMTDPPLEIVGSDGKMEKVHYWRCGIPLIGAGLAGGDWEEIRKIIDEVTPNMAITVVEWDGTQ